MKKEFATAQALATAVAAFEFNKSSIVRAPVTIDGVGFLSNRQLIQDYLNGNGAPFVVNEIHYKQADGIITYLQQVGLMQTLAKGSTDNFLGNIIKLLTEEKITGRDLGILAWAPKVSDDYQKKDHVRQVSAQYELNSRYIGRVGEKVSMTFTHIESRYITSMDCYAVYGHNENGDLVFYWAKDQKKIVKQGRIQGKVKLHDTDRYHGNARVTTINYVKVL